MAHIDVEHTPTAVVEIIAATAIAPTVAAFGKIAMGYGVEVQCCERDEVLTTIGVCLHQCYKAEAREAEAEAEIHHAMRLGCGVDIAAYEVATGVELHHVNALETEGRLGNIGAIKC